MPATFASGLAMTQVPLTDVYELPLVETYPDQLRDVLRTPVFDGVCGWVGCVGLDPPVLPGWVFDSIFHEPFWRSRT
jgi:hypothetical protein